MNEKIETTKKKTVVKKADNSKKYWMTENEFTGIISLLRRNNLRMGFEYCIRSRT
jgi:hypothetical protein